MNSIENTVCVPTGSIVPRNDVKQEIAITKISGIYKITNKINNKYYIGSSSNTFGNSHARWERHIYMLEHNIHSNIHLQRSWNKYGKINFNFIIVELCNSENLIQTEQKYLDIANSSECYNISFIAGKVEMTPEIKYILSQKQKKKLSNKINHPMYGKHHTHKTKELLKQKCPHIGSKNGMYGIHKFHGIPMKNLMDITGKNNPAYNHTIYNFFNKSKNEFFTGTHREFCDKYNIQYQNIRLLIRGKWNSTFGWSVKPA